MKAYFDFLIFVFHTLKLGLATKNWTNS